MSSNGLRLFNLERKTIDYIIKCHIQSRSRNIENIKTSPYCLHSLMRVLLT